MKFEPTSLAGAYLVHLEPRADERGMFARAFCAQEFAAEGLETSFVQANISINSRSGTVRGMHFQRGPDAEVKLVRSVKGAIYDVVVDMREDSPTYLRWFGAELSEDNGLDDVCAEGVCPRLSGAYRRGGGFLYRERLLRACSRKAVLRFDDPKLAIRWPRVVSEVSDKDADMAAARPLILLTGATGFVGRQVLRELVARNCRVRVVVRKGKQEQIGQSIAIEKMVATSDMWSETAAWWSETCRGVDTVIHIAWYAEPGKYLHSPMNRDCLEGTLRLAQGANRRQSPAFCRHRHLL